MPDGYAYSCSLTPVLPVQRRVDQKQGNFPNWPMQPCTPRLCLACWKCDFSARRGKRRRPLADALSAVPQLPAALLNGSRSTAERAVPSM